MRHVRSTFAHPRRAILGASHLVLAIGLLACGGGGYDAGTSPTTSQPPGSGTTPSRTPGSVAMRDNSFNPATDTIAVGGTVTWTNTGNAAHTSTGANGLWDSGIVSPGQAFSRQFPAAGSFAYTCTLHPGMNGTIVVR